MAAKPKMIITRKEALEWADQHEETKQWLGRFKIGITKIRYARYLLTYCRYTGLNPGQLIELKQQQQNHDAEKLLDRFVAEADIPQSTVGNISIAVKSFYKWNYEDLARASGRVVRAKIHPYRTPTQKDLKRLIIATNPRDKAVILFMAATRVREKTVCLLNWDHLWHDLFEEPTDPPHIPIMARDLKGGGGNNYAGLEQHTFLTPDSKKALLEYKEWREKRTGETITRKSPLFKSVYRRSLANERVTTDLIRKILVRASKRTGLKFSPHDLGRFTQTQLENAGIQPNWIKKIVGHKVRGEENPYSRPKIEQLREAYKRAIPFLTTEIEETIPGLKERDKRIEDLQEKVRQLRTVDQDVEDYLRAAGHKLDEKIKRIERFEKYLKTKYSKIYKEFEKTSGEVK